MGLKRPASTDFSVKVSDAGVEVTFHPTQSYYSFSRLADAEDIARHGHLSDDVRVRHGGATGDTAEYDSHEVLAEASRLASGAAAEAYSKS